MQSTRYIRGAYPFEPAMQFKEIAAALGISTTQAKKDFERGMRKLGCSRQLLRIWQEYRSESQDAARRVSTPYPRTMRYAVSQVGAAELGPAQ